jgi:hypothetical protein
MGDRSAINKRLDYHRRCLDYPSRMEHAVFDPGSLTAAAQFFKLDLAADYQREILLRVLADVLFGKRRGRPKGSNSKWHRHRRTLLALVYERAKAAFPELSDAKIAKLMSESGRSPFKGENPEQLRQRLIAARRELDGERRLIASGRNSRKPV